MNDRFNRTSPGHSTADSLPVGAITDSASPDATLRQERLGAFLIYFVMGSIFGIILIKSEVVSWFRIQEMFRFQAFHMYGVIGSAVVVGMISLQVIKRFNVKTIYREAIEIADKPWGSGVSYIAGGLIFGFGWALLGACPGPIYALLGAGISVIFVALAAALAGTWTYAKLKRHLPH